MSHPATSLSERLRATLPPERQPPPEADARVQQLAAWSLTFTRMLEQQPTLWHWLERGVPLELPFTFAELERLWARMDAQLPEEPPPRAHLRALQRLRRQVSLRIAYRDLNALGTLEQSHEELTLLAEFCVRIRYAHLHGKLEKRFGLPWDERDDRPARFCILALGKLGAGELNFCSDIDILFLYDGDGTCRRAGKATTMDNREFFTRLANALCSDLQERSEDGMLYHVDMRLRPEGDAGPLIRSVESATNHYWTQGQNWERLALTRARFICGDATAGGEFLEEIHPFRYPRNSPIHLANEIGGLKLRIEKESESPKALERDIKNGHGGIREVEFICQYLQIMHGGRNPFLQNPNTCEALRQLALYGLLDSDSARKLIECYRSLRRIENRLQMREDARDHCLPQDETGRELLKKSFDQVGEPVCWDDLEAKRHWLRERFCQMLPYSRHEEAVQAWTHFLEGHPPNLAVAEALARWFPHAESPEQRLRQFVLGPRSLNISRDQVLRFMQIAEEFDGLLPYFARPMQTLERVGDFAESYGARRAFFQSCAETPPLFQTLAILFDRSVFIFDLLKRNPGIMEELLNEAPKREKDTITLLEEISQLPQDEHFQEYLWLYVRAEQVRIAIAQLLHGLGVRGCEIALTRLADATIHSVLERIDPGGSLCVIALGKYGSGELNFGSDLDLLLLGKATNSQRARGLFRSFGSASPQGVIYTLDLRLRPFGTDGPLVTTPEALANYHRDGHARIWERQMLTRARFVGGNANLASAFRSWKTCLLYNKPTQKKDLQTIWEMRERIRLEKTSALEDAFALKAGRGGLLDIEFLAQTLQLAFGSTMPALRDPRTREVLRRAQVHPNLRNPMLTKLLEHHDYLRMLELYLRRYRNTPVNHIEEDPDTRRALAVWMGEVDFNSFAQAHRNRMEQARILLKEFLAESLNLIIK